MNNQTSRQVKELPDWLFKKNNKEERDYAYKVVDRNFRSISARGKYCQDYFVGNTVEALPGTIGLRLFKEKNNAKDNANGITESKVLRVAPCEDDAFYLPHLRCLLAESEDELDKFYAILQQQKIDNFTSAYLELYNNDSLAEYIKYGKIVYCQKVIVLTTV